MKAWSYEQYGGPEVVHLQEVPTPTPARNEILVKVVATTVTAGDWRALTLEMPPGFGLFGRLMFGVLGPRKEVLGMEFAGVVHAVGAAVTRFKTGDAVFGSSGAGWGCHAEFVAVPEDGHVALKPANVSFDEAAALSFGGGTALHFLDAARVRPDERVLVIGASGGVGSACVQVAKHLGAHVTGVTSGRNAAMVQSLGADAVVDYTQEDALRPDAAFDVIVDTVGETSFTRCRPALRSGGRFVVVAGSFATLVTSPARSLVGDKKVIVGVAEESRAVAERLSALAADGVLRPFIDERFDFARLPDAHALVASRRKRGNVVVVVAQQGSP